MRFLSLFDGIGAATTAWTPLGWECVGVSEVEPFPIAVTKHHYPDVPHLGDVTKITEEQIAALGRIDLVVGGFPCQDLSVAGKRAGLRNADGTTTRSGLFYDAMRVVQWARKHGGARWLCIENVPGLFSSAQGRDFAAVVGAMVGTDFDVPRDGWRNAGVAAGPEGLCEWATLDAQFFGLAQRRKRCFLIGDFGDWASRPPVLFERESLQRHPPPSRKTREVAPTIHARSTGGGGLGTDFDCDGGVISMAHGQGGAEIGFDRGPTLTCNHEAPIVAHSPRGEGFDASEDGPGRGTPLVPVAYSIMPMNSGKDYKARATDVAQPLMAGGPVGGNQGGDFIAQPVHAFDARQSDVIQYGDMTGPLDTDGHSVAIAFSGKDYGGDATADLSPTLRSMGHDGSHANGGGQVAVAIPIISDADRADSSAQTPSPDAEGRIRLRDPGLGIGDDGDPMFTLQATKPHAVAFDTTQITSPANYSNPQPGGPCHLLAAQAHAPAIVQPYTLAIRGRAGDSVLEARQDGTANALLTPSGGRAGIGVGAIAFQTRGSNLDVGDISGTMSTNADRASGSAPMVAITQGDGDASAQETHAPSALRALRIEVGAEAFAQWGLGILDSLQRPEVLRQALHGIGIRPAPFSRSWVVCCALGSPFTRSEGAVQSVREAMGEGCSSQGWQPSEQLADELGAYLSQLSQPGAQAERFMRDLQRADEGSGLLRDALSAIQAMGRPAHGQGQPAHGGMQVRRLTVEECEFLQGFPRSYTAIPISRRQPIEGQPAVVKMAADGPRYKALGNSMAVPVMRWIGQRIELAELEGGA